MREHAQAAAISIPDTLAQRGVECEFFARFDEADALYGQALRIDPECQKAKVYRGCLRLSQGRFREGWALLENRDKPKHVGAMPPRWRGENLRGKTLMVILEAGFGDQLQFARFVPMLRAHGARIGMMCPRPLGRIYKSLAGVNDVFCVGPLLEGVDSTVSAPGIPDYFIEICSLPHVLRIDADQLPNSPYLHADPADVQRWRPRLPQGALRVGLVWYGGVHNIYDRWRSLPALDSLAPLWDVPGVSFVSLQKGRGEDEARASTLSLTHLGSDVRDFADTAAILSELDLLITVDTSTAHLAHALGLPVWLMLNPVPDWRNRPDSMRRWFPQARGFYQHALGDWSRVIENVREALREFAASRPSAAGRAA